MEGALALPKHQVLLAYNRCPIENGKDVHIIFLKYRTIFKCLIRLMVLKKRAQTRIIARKSLRVANLFRGIGHSNLNPHIISFIWKISKNSIRIFFFLEKNWNVFSRYMKHNKPHAISFRNRNAHQAIRVTARCNQHPTIMYCAI